MVGDAARHGVQPTAAGADAERAAREGLWLPGAR